jgi:predicted double-glycine peptidase
MNSFRTWLEETEEFESESGAHIKVHLPSVKQNHNYDCGAACLRAVCEHFKVGPEKEADFIKACKTSKKNGTTPQNIIKCAQQFGLNARPKSGMSFDDMKSVLDMGRPIICCIQAYGEKDEYHKPVAGHYVIAIGYDEKYVYFEDPSMTGSRGVLPYKEFAKRWHDKGIDGNTYTRWGVVIWKPSGEETDREFVPQAKKIP